MSLKDIHSFVRKDSELPTFANDTPEKLLAQARQLTYNGSVEEAITKHRLYEEVMRLETGYHEKRKQNEKSD